MTYQIPEEFRIPVASGGGKNLLTLEWAGTAGFKIEYGGKMLLIDPNVTRPRLPRYLFASLPINKELCREVFPKADEIFIGHSHYDHLQDAPEIAIRTGATIHGSSSTAVVCRAWGVPEKQIHVIKLWTPFQAAGLKVTFVPGIHGKAVMGRIPSPGPIASVERVPMRGSEYRLGAVFGILFETADGFRVFHSGSADLIDNEVEKVGAVDVLLICLAGRKHTPDYVKRLASRLKPKVVIPHHYDNFFSPLKKGLKLLPGIRMDSFIEEARRECPDSRMLIPALFEKASFDTAAKKVLG